MVFVRDSIFCIDITGRSHLSGNDLYQVISNADYRPSFPWLSGGGGGGGGGGGCLWVIQVFVSKSVCVSGAFVIRILDLLLPDNYKVYTLVFRFCVECVFFPLVFL